MTSSMVLVVLGLLLSAPTPPIVNGTPENGEPGVVVIYNYGYGAMCTGTLIEPDMVLTAKHCVMTESGQELPVDRFVVGVGSNVYAISQQFGVSRVYHTDGVAVEDKDLAILVLSSPANGIPTYDMVLDLDSIDLVPNQTPMVLIGYGLGECGQDTQDSGTKRRTTDTFAGWYSTNDIVTTGNGANSGDSGGPMFTQDMKLVAVMSRASAAGGQCDPGYTIGTAVAKQREFLAYVYGQEGKCLKISDEEKCGNDTDDNCDGRVDEGCGHQGDPCTEGWQCASGMCYQLENGDHVCIDGCSGDDDCPSGSHCVTIACGERMCLPGEYGTLAEGESCVSYGACATGFCAETQDGKECRYSCTPDANECPWNRFCEPIGNGCGACLEHSSGKRGLGEACTSDSDCKSGSCLSDGGLSYCSASCSGQGDCPSGMHCRDGMCRVGRQSGLGEPCLGDGDCEDGLVCRQDDGLRTGHCTKECTDSSECGDLQCVGLVDGNWCWAPSGSALPGEECGQGIDCVGGYCVQTDDGRFVCVEGCVGLPADCPATTVCESHGTRAECVPTESAKAPEGSSSGDSGFCAVGGTREPPIFVLLGTILALLAAGTRRRIYG